MSDLVGNPEDRFSRNEAHLTDRRSDLEEEKKHEDQIDAAHGHSFRDRYMDVKDRETSTAGNFAELLRYCTVIMIYVNSVKYEHP